MDLRSILDSFGDLVKKGWKSLDASTQRIVLGGGIFLAGATLPWSALGEVGTYIQFGMIVGGILSAYSGVKKPKGNKEEVILASHCVSCGLQLADDEPYCPHCGRKRRMIAT